MPFVNVMPGGTVLTLMGAGTVPGVTSVLSVMSGAGYSLVVRYFERRT